MINLLGKTLVVLNLALSVVFLAFATAVYMNKVDWGWKEPRKQLNARVPSEIDKRTAAVKSFLRLRDEVEAALAKEQMDLEANEQIWGDYHLDYAHMIDQLYNAAGDIKVQNIKIEKGVLAENKTQPGKPMLQDAIVVYTDGAGNKTPVTKSFKELDEMQRKLQAEAKKLTQDLVAETEKQKETTDLIAGIYDPKGKKIKIGIHDAIEEEKQLQKTVMQTIETIEPVWVRKLVDSQILVERRDALLARLKELQGKTAEKKP